MHAPQTQTQWKTVLEMHKPYLALSLKVAEVEGKRYLKIFVDDFSDWKEFAIYTAAGEIEETVKKIQALVEKAENDESDPVPKIAELIAEIVDEFIVGEVPEEIGVCSDDDYIAYPHEDERLSWPLCYGGPSARSHLLLLRRYGLLPEEWISHIQRRGLA